MKNCQLWDLQVGCSGCSVFPMCCLPVTDGDQQKPVSDLDLIFTIETPTLMTQNCCKPHYITAHCIALLTLPHVFTVQNFDGKCNRMTAHCAKLDSSELW